MFATRPSALLAISILLGACVANDDGGAEDADAGALFLDASRGCQIASGADPAWLLGAQDSDLRKLTGVEATPFGVTLSERSTASNRTATRDYLQARLSALGYSSMLDDYGTGKNVFAELAATVSTTNTIVVGAHFDSVPKSPGANDNATGVAMVLSAAQYATELPCRSQNIIFVFFDEEELGLLGSDNFAQLLTRPEFGADLSAVHTIDQNGWDQDGDRAFELEQPDGNLFALYSAAKQLAGANMPIYETTTGATDHISFRSRGISAIGITEEYANGDTTPHYHLETDTYATLNREYLASTTRILLTMLGSSVSASRATWQPSQERFALAERYRAATREPRTVTRLPPHGCRAAVTSITQ